MGLTSGTRLGPYEIRGPLGAGGMGEVYRAHDPKLKRDIAIKVLPTADADRRARFEREAQSIAALNHPNIVTIYSVEEADGVLFLTMELVEGDPLDGLIAKGGLPLTRILAVAIPLADAVSAAHQKGITHRDLKPANVMVAADGRVKVLDFGLAKLVETAPVAAGMSQLPTRGLTGEGRIVGTVAYMSPEQAEGKAVDHRSDIFSLGVMLYELSTGERPFKGDTQVSLLSSILRDTPRSVTDLKPAMPRELSRIIKRCLVKDPEYRCQGAKDLRNELRELQQESDAADAEQPTSTTGEPSTAVLPFTNLNADPENQFFSDGLTEDLINALTRVPGLHVAARTSAFRFRGGDVDIRQVGKDLRVATVVEGSVRRVGTRLRVTAQLINVADGYHLWSERYDRELADVFAIQDEIVEAIVKAIAPALAVDTRTVVRRPTDNLEAYESYLRGRQYWHQRSPALMPQAIRSFEQALALDPDYTLAYAGLADCHAILKTYGWLSYAMARPSAEASLQRAVALDPTLPEVQYAQALFIVFFERSWLQAEPHFRRAIELNPRWSTAHAYYGMFLATAYRLDEASAKVNVALDLDPLSPFVHGIGAMALFIGRAYLEAERLARRALDLQPDYLLGLYILGRILTDSGRAAEAIPLLERVVALSRAPLFVGTLGEAYGLARRMDDLTQLENELEERRSRGEYIVPLSLLLLAMGRRNPVLIRRVLEECVIDNVAFCSLRVGAGPLLDEWRTDAGIDAVLQRLGDGVRLPGATKMRI